MCMQTICKVKHTKSYKILYIIYILMLNLINQVYYMFDFIRMGIIVTIQYK